MKDDEILVKTRDIIRLAQAYREQDQGLFEESIRSIVQTLRDNGCDELADFLYMMIDDTGCFFPM